MFADLDGNFSEISAEEVVTPSPDVVLVVYDDVSGDATSAIAEIEQMLALSPAVAEGRIVPISYSAFSASGISLIDVIEDVAAAVQG